MSPNTKIVRHLQDISSCQGLLEALLGLPSEGSEDELFEPLPIFVDTPLYQDIQFVDDLECSTCVNRRPEALRSHDNL